MWEDKWSFRRVSRRLRGGERSDQRDRRHYRARILEFETRTLLSNFPVVSPLDDGAEGTLRWAIEQSNANGADETDLISFDIDPAVHGLGPYLITPTTPFPDLLTPVVIDGYSQPGAAPNTLPDSSNAVLQIVLDGVATQWGDGLTVSGGGSTIRGLAFNRFQSAIVLAGPSGGNRVEGNFIGTDASGAVSGDAYANIHGVFLSGSSDNTIGGTSPDARNVISGNFNINVYSAFGSSRSVIQGNLLGLTAAGTAALPSYGYNILITDSSGNTIGGADPAARNVIAGQAADGIRFVAVSGTAIQGNYIGTDVTGTVDLGQAGSGLFFDYLSLDNTIGGTAPGAGNVISGNGTGITISESTARNLIQGNFIGTDASGTAPLGNDQSGIVLDRSSDNTVGGTTAGAGNVISANGGDGIAVSSAFFSQSQFNIIQGNYIGTNADGAGGLGNAANGVFIWGGSSNNTVGGPGGEAGNVIAFNGGAGVAVGVNFSAPNYDPAIGNAILSNSIHDNAGLGIDLGSDGRTRNDRGDIDPGPNNHQNAPVITASATNVGTSAVKGILKSEPGTTYLVQFFSNLEADPSGFGEGRTYLGTAEATTDENGQAVFQFQSPVTLIAGQFITATATSPGGDTSEFSNALAVIDVSGPIHAADDHYLVSPGRNLIVSAPGLLANDLDVNGGILTAALVEGSGPAHGTLTLNPDGSFQYQPDPGFQGLDSFTYVASAGPGLSDEAVVTLDVNPVVYTVTNTDDGGVGSLRWAILEANDQLDADFVTIAFAIPGVGPFTIAPLSPLPTITRQVVVDGFSQPGSHPNTLADGSDAVLQIVLDGLYFYGTGLDLNASDSTIRGLVFNRFVTALNLGPGSGRNVVEGNSIGVDSSGSNADYATSNGWGLALNNSTDNTIGGTTPAARNIISGNQSRNIDLTQSSRNVIQGNLIGLTATGALPYTEYGILLNGSDGNTIGGTTPAERNVITGPGQVSVWVAGSNNLIAGNYLGTDVAGDTALAGSWTGIRIASGSLSNTIGGTASGAGNLIAAQGTAIGLDYDSAGSLIAGNFIGTNAAGSPGLGNGTGIFLIGTGNNTIGGTAAAAANVISGNAMSAIEVFYSPSDQAGSVIQGNFIGTDASGTLDLGNGGYGISLGWGASNNLIGGLEPGAGNVIAFNRGNGVVVGLSPDDPAVNNAILSNSIFGNAGLGIDLGLDGPSPNDQGDGDPGPNHLQNFPDLSAAGNYLGITHVKGTMTGTPSTAYTLQFFANPAPDPSGYGQGQVLAGTMTVVTGDDGSAAFQFALTVEVPGGQILSATATDPDGNTSEFSKDISVAESGGPVLAQDDAYRTQPHVPLTVAGPGVLGNDLDFLGQPLTSELVAGSGPAHGTLALNPDGSFTYTPDPGYQGLDSFRYLATAGPGESGVATVTIDVSRSNFVVTNINDDGTGSLRWAITQADAEPGPLAPFVTFAIPGTGPFVIDPSTPLPPITRPIEIDGYTQPGASPNTLDQASDAVLQVVLSGASAGGGDGLAIAASGVTIRGLVFRGFSNAIHLMPGSSSSTIAGNFIGTDPTGFGADGNVTGVLVDGSWDNLIGGTSPADRNLISGNFTRGILLANGASGNRIAGNWIGLDASGASVFWMYGDGIDIWDAAANTVGGTVTGARNVIAGHLLDGIQIRGTGNVVQGNFIGTDASGTIALGNGEYGTGGVYLVGGASGNSIGGSSPGAGNLISGNRVGVSISGDSSGNVLQGNLIGTDAGVNLPLGNQYGGIVINGPNNQIGGTEAGAGNTVVATLYASSDVGGVVLLGDAATGNAILGNFIGTDAAGTSGLGNAGAGVLLGRGASGNTIGGLDPGAGNTIEFNGGAGVLVGSQGLDDLCIDNAILSNSIDRNAGLGIDLGGNGVTPNDPGDDDSGPNRFQNYPALIAAADFGTVTSIRASLDSTPGTTFIVQFFFSPAPDPSGHGEGRSLLGTTTVTTDGAGHATFQGSFPGSATAGQVLSATATDPAGNTSEFSADFVIAQATSSLAAFDDEFYTDVNTELVIPASGVLDNDLSRDGGPFTATLVAGPSRGKLTLNPDGSFTYRPQTNFVGTVTFTYQDRQGSTLSNVATVTIHVNPNTFTVTNTSDAGEGSLRWALSMVNRSNSSVIDQVRFAIPGTGPFTISPATALPEVTHAVVINGYSQPGASPNTLADGDNAVLQIVLDGGGLVAPGDGLVLSGGRSTVRGLVVHRFDTAIALGGPGNLVAGNFLGTDRTGEVALANATGVSVRAGSGNTVGGTTPAARNVISGNVWGISVATDASGVVIQGNFIGTNASGRLAVWNVLDGIFLGGSGAQIGGTTPGAGNLISGNSEYGIRVYQATGASIRGNRIGTDVSGTYAIGNRVGVQFEDAPANTVGGRSTEARNLISGNGSGISLLGRGATGNLIQGNFIGTDATGLNRVGNQFNGIHISRATRNSIGGDASRAGNVISGNVWFGITDDTYPYPEEGGSNLIQGNFIGTDATGRAPMGNGYNGISISTPGNTIGGRGSPAANVIAASGGDGIVIQGPGGNRVLGNAIGTDLSGSIDLGNAGSGVFVRGSSGNLIGGLEPGARNAIAFNHHNGVTIAPGWNGEPSVGNAILSNAIFANAGLGIDLGDDGVTSNDQGDADGGSNQLQNAPILVVAARKGNGNQVSIKGQMQGAAGTTYTVQFFANSDADPSGYGEGRWLIGTASVATGPDGSAWFQFSYNFPASLGKILSATATDPAGNTSEFARDLTILSTQGNLLAQDDAYSVQRDRTLSVAASGVQANDLYLPGGSFESSVVAPPSHGSVTLRPDGSFDYTPDPGFEGTDTFAYVNKRGGQSSNVATVSIEVGALRLVVTQTADGGEGSLRWAISEANAQPADEPIIISFAIPGSGPFIIAVASPLPAITSPVVIDGYSQPGASPNTLADGNNAVLQIIVDGGFTYGMDGLTLAGNGSTIKGLVLSGFWNGIRLLPGSGGNTISGNFIGTDASGSVAQPNAVGIFAEGSSGNTIGGTTPGDRNIVSGNNNDNIVISDGGSGNVVAGNWVGLTAAGTSALSTYGRGVSILNSDGNTVGGTDPAARNVVAGQAADGILIVGSANLVAGNYVGTDASGTGNLGNGYWGGAYAGVALRGSASNNTVGGTAPGAGNLISGNYSGVIIDQGAGNNLVQGNLIGTDPTGTSLNGNLIGMIVYGPDNLVGGAEPGAGNLIGGSELAGIGFFGATATGNRLQGNFIGTDPTGTLRLGNGDPGILIGGGASSNQIGGLAPGEGNIIAFNQVSGVQVGAFDGDVSYGNAILSNAIHDNGGLGIRLLAGGNNNQAAPSLNTAVHSAGDGTSTIEGTLTGTPGATYTLQFFASDLPDPSGSGEGQRLLWTEMLTLDGTGSAAFAVTFSSADIVGQAVTATATSPIGDTSQFSNAIVATSSTIAASVQGREGTPSPLLNSPGLKPRDANSSSTLRSAMTSLVGILDESTLDAVARELVSTRRSTPGRTRRLFNEARF